MVSWPPTPQPDGVFAPVAIVNAQPAQLPIALPRTPDTILVHRTASLLREPARWPAQSADDRRSLGLDYRLVGDDLDAIVAMSLELGDPALVVEAFQFFRLGAGLVLSGGTPGAALPLRVAARFASGLTHHATFALPVLAPPPRPALPANTLIIGGVPIAIGGPSLLLE